MARIAALDANVLWPQYLRDVLIRAAIFDMFRAVWTDQILNEMRDSLLRKGKVQAERIDRTISFMREQCPHFMVEGYDALIPVMTNHPKDRHVLAAAVHAGADTIVTYNGKDFPLASREHFGIDVHTPDDFLMDLWLTDPGRMSSMLVDMANGFQKPPLTPRDLVGNQLAKQAPTFARVVLNSDELEKAADAFERQVPPPSYRFL